jgi:hypothetical protein
LSKFLNLTVAGFAGHAVLDIESGNLPILSADQRIEVEQTDFAALGGGLLVLAIRAASDGERPPRPRS